MKQCVNRGMNNIIIRTADTDVVMILLGHLPSIIDEFGDSIKIFVQFGVDKNIKIFNLNSILFNLGNEKCKGILFFHAFSGCDYTSSFYSIGKCKWWDRYIESSETFIAQFINLSQSPQYISRDICNLWNSLLLKHMTKNCLVQI